MGIERRGLREVSGRREQKKMGVLRKMENLFLGGKREVRTGAGELQIERLTEF